MAYEFDIFLSYKRGQQHGTWVNEILWPLLAPYIEDAVGGRDIRIFKDDREILSGSEWEKSIMKSLLNSRIMVAVLSPKYFNSEWCIREFQMFHYRQIRLGYMSEENTNGLIVPIKLNDGDYFPICVGKIQSLDCRNYFKTGEGFTKTTQYADLQDKLNAWSHDVAHAIKNSPEWSEEWKEKEWIENSKLMVDLTTVEPTTPPLL